MVRFAWHVEDGLNAFMLPGAYNNVSEGTVRHVSCEVEVPHVKETLTTCLTLPADYLDVSKIKTTGIILAHGNNASEWKGKLLSEIANTLAAQGYVVMRYCCRLKEQRRQRMFEKALDACAVSPFARGIKQWVLAGYGTGARVAAYVGNRCRGNIAGYVLLSYPLLEPIATPSKPKRGEGDLDLAAPTLSSSAQPLDDITQPALFVVGSNDHLCPLEDLASKIKQMPSQDIRVEVCEDANGEFRCGQNKTAAPSAMYTRLCSCISDFIDSLENGTLESCLLKRPHESLPTVAEPRLANGEDAEMRDVETEPLLTEAGQPEDRAPSDQDLKPSTIPQSHIAPSSQNHSDEAHRAAHNQGYGQDGGNLEYGAAKGLEALAGQDNIHPNGNIAQTSSDIRASQPSHSLQLDERVSHQTTNSGSIPMSVPGSGFGTSLGLQQSDRMTGSGFGTSLGLQQSDRTTGSGFGTSLGLQQPDRIPSAPNTSLPSSMQFASSSLPQSRLLEAANLPQSAGRPHEASLMSQQMGYGGFQGGLSQAAPISQAANFGMAGTHQSASMPTYSRQLGSAHLNSWNWPPPSSSALNASNFNQEDMFQKDEPRG